MGKDIHLYGLEYQKMRTGFAHMFAQDQDTKLFFESCMWAKLIDPAPLLEKIRQPQAAFQIDDIWHLHDFFYDWWVEQYGEKDYKGLDHQLSQLGLSEIYEIPVTNPSCVFMSELHRCFPEMETDILEIGDQNYRLSKNQLAHLLNHLEAVCNYIYEKEESPEKFDESAFRPEMRAELAGLYARICAERDSGSTDYMGKWGEDYFSFSYSGPAFSELKNQIDDFDEFLIFDSY